MSKVKGMIGEDRLIEGGSGAISHGSGCGSKIPVGWGSEFGGMISK